MTLESSEWQVEQQRLAAGKKRREKEKARAVRWGVPLHKLKRLVKDGAPIYNDAKMVDWFFALANQRQELTHPTLKAKIYELRAAQEGNPAPVAEAEALTPPDKATVRASANEDDSVEFEKTYLPDSADGNANIASIKREAAFYLFKLKRARARKDHIAESQAAKQFQNFSNLVHDCEVRAARLGRDLGDSFSAADVDRLGHAMAYWLRSSADELISKLATAFAKSGSQLDRETIRRILEPLVISERVMLPLVRAA